MDNATCGHLAASCWSMRDWAFKTRGLVAFEDVVKRERKSWSGSGLDLNLERDRIMLSAFYGEWSWTNAIDVADR